MVCNISTPQNPHTLSFLGAKAARRRDAEAAAEKERVHTGGIVTYPNLRTPASLASSVQRCQAERRRAAEAAAEKERVEAYRRYCNTSTTQNPRTLSFLGATLPGRAPQSCKGSRRKGASGGILVLQHIHTSEPPRP